MRSFSTSELSRRPSPALVLLALLLSVLGSGTHADPPQRIDHDDPWFEVYRVLPGVFTVREPGHWERVRELLDRDGERRRPQMKTLASARRSSVPRRRRRRPSTPASTK